ncbi:MAG TPA: hypothetical protein VMI94_00225 [Bryobacteraceae bacterium]|nr:hypothetical protein [Bryobacteraceae bacterium]
MKKYLVVVHVDVQEAEEKKNLNTPGGEGLLTRVGGGSQGVPFFAFLDGSGEMIGNSIAPAANGRKAANIGHPYEPHEVDWFMVLLSKSAPRMTGAEREAIEKPLRAQKK